jgi:hypothetical protein
MWTQKTQFLTEWKPPSPSTETGLLVKNQCKYAGHVNLLHIRLSGFEVPINLFDTIWNFDRYWEFWI